MEGVKTVFVVYRRPSALLSLGGISKASRACLLDEPDPTYFYVGRLGPRPLYKGWWE